MLSKCFQVAIICFIFPLFIQACKPYSRILDKGLIYCLEDDPVFLNPQKTASQTTYDVTSGILFDTLIEYDPKSSIFVPALATSWSVTDAKNYTFNLRKNVRFHKTEFFFPSRPLLAIDVQYTFERIINTSHPLHHVNTNHFYGLSQHTINNIASITVDGAHQVTFHLKEADNSFMAQLSSPAGSIQSLEYANYLATIDEATNIDFSPIGTGPYALESYIPNHVIRYTKHMDYWREKQNFGQLIFNITPNNRHRLSKLTYGDCSISTMPQFNDLTRINQHKHLKIKSKMGSNTAYLAFNIDAPPLNQKEIRRAIAIAINKPDILSHIYSYTAETATTLLPKKSWGHIEPLVQFPFDQAQAKVLIKKLTTDPIELNLWVSRNARHYNPNALKMAQLIQAELQKIGIQLHIKSYNWSHLVSKLHQHDFDLVLLGWSADYDDPDNFYSSILSCNGRFNYSQWCHPTFENLLSQARHSNNRAERRYIYQQVEKIIFNEVPLIPIAHGSRIFMFEDKLKNFSFLPNGVPNFQGIKIETRGQRS
jgi:cationic peptide transport system substrate-binding protein